MKASGLIRRESGQVAILIALAMVGLIGFAALAIDGGMLYSDRRMAQNAADAAAMAGALTRGQNKSSAIIISNAMAQAAANGFDNNGTTNWVDVVYPYNGDNNLVQVKIKANTNTSFIQLVYKGASQSQVEAVGRVRAGGPISLGNAIAAMCKHCDGAIRYNGGGNGSVDAYNGNIFSNSDINAFDIQINGKAYVHANNGGQILAVSPTSNIKGSIDPGLKSNQPQLSLPNVPAPDCDSIYKDQKATKDYFNPGGAGPLQPGKYSGGNVDGVKMAPGLYCIYGDWTLNGSGKTPLTNTDSTKDGVMLYFINGSLKINGNFNLQLNSPSRKKGEHLKLLATDGQTYDYAGFLIYQAVGNTDTMKMLGGADLKFRGTIFAPSAECEMGGNNNQDGNLSSQLVCNTVWYHGTTGMSLYYDGAELASLPASIELFK